MLIIYDYKLACESQTRPATRIAPLKFVRAKRLVRAVIESRSEAFGYQEPSLVPGDMYFLFDGGKPANLRKLKSIFTITDGDEGEEAERAMQAHPKELTLIFNEDCVAERRVVVRNSIASMKMKETICLVTKHRACIPRRARKNLPGTTNGDCMIDVPMLAESKLWKLTIAEKRLIYDKYRVPVGGKGEDKHSDSSDDEAPQPSPAKKRKDDVEEQEPVFFTEPSPILLEELAHAGNAKGIIDLTMGSGHWAILAVLLHIPYFGVALTAQHQAKVLEHIIQEALPRTNDINIYKRLALHRRVSSLYYTSDYLQPEVSEHFKPGGALCHRVEVDPKAKPKPKPKPKPKVAPRPVPGGEGSESSPSPADSEPEDDDT